MFNETSLNGSEKISRFLPKVLSLIPTVTIVNRIWRLATIKWRLQCQGVVMMSKITNYLKTLNAERDCCKTYSPNFDSMGHVRIDIWNVIRQMYIALEHSKRQKSNVAMQSSMKTQRLVRNTLKLSNRINWKRQRYQESQKCGHFTVMPQL